MGLKKQHHLANDFFDPFQAPLIRSKGLSGRSVVAVKTRRSRMVDSPLMNESASGYMVAHKNPQKSTGFRKNFSEPATLVW